jgi:hypothetical protein
VPLVDDVQDQLEAIYDIRCPRVSGFLLSAEAAAALRAPAAEEELWFREEGETLELGLYLAPRLRAEVGHRSLREEGWVESSLDAYCRLAEGVSHFLYLVHSAALGRRLSILEMEAQGEVDKFASVALHLWPTLDGAAAHALHRRLFERARLRAGLPAAERFRYTEASRLGANFAARLLGDCAARRLDRVLGALRHAYRLGAEAKLQHLARAR